MDVGEIKKTGGCRKREICQSAIDSEELKPPLFNFHENLCYFAGVMFFSSRCLAMHTTF